MRIRSWTLLLVSFAVVVGACSGDDTTADPDAIVGLSTDRMREVDSVAFTLDRTGVPVFIDEDGLLEFTAADGRFAAPESAEALLTVRALGIPTQVGAVQIGGETWLTNPITGNWEAAPPGFTFDVATLFDPETGWSALLSGGFTNTFFVGEEELEGETLAHFRVTAPADRVEQITAGMVRDQAVDADLWIAGSTGEIRELSFDTDMADGVTTWRLRLTDYGLDVEITAPDG